MANMAKVEKEVWLECPSFFGPCLTQCKLLKLRERELQFTQLWICPSQFCLQSFNVTFDPEDFKFRLRYLYWFYFNPNSRGQNIVIENSCRLMLLLNQSSWGIYLSNKCKAKFVNLGRTLSISLESKSLRVKCINWKFQDWIVIMPNHIRVNFIQNKN